MRAPVVGSSYELRVERADVGRTINMFPVALETNNGKTRSMLESIPGLTLLYDTGNPPIRSMFAANNRLFVMAHHRLIEIRPDGSATQRGEISSIAGPVDMSRNRYELILVDGDYGYVMNFQNNFFVQMFSENFHGSRRVTVINGRAVFVDPESQVFRWSDIDAALTIDALAFDSAVYKNDKLVCAFQDHGQLFLFGEISIEIQDASTGTDSPFVLNTGARIETGCLAPFTICALDNTIYWLGQDANGVGMVYKLVGYTATRISNHALEQALQETPNLADAVAYAYQQDGHSFYVLQVPDLDLTPTYEVETGKWCDRAELVDGEYEPHRGIYHAFVFGKHFIGGEDGKIYSYDPTVNNNAGDILVRDRIFRSHPDAGTKAATFASFQPDCIVGKGKQPDEEAPDLMVRWSNDGGRSFGGWRTVGLGNVGQRKRKPRINLCGYANDVSQRVWHVRHTDDAPFALLGADID